MVQTGAKCRPLESQPRRIHSTKARRPRSTRVSKAGGGVARWYFYRARPITIARSGSSVFRIVIGFSGWRRKRPNATKNTVRIPFRGTLFGRFPIRIITTRIRIGLASIVNLFRIALCTAGHYLRHWQFAAVVPVAAK